MKQRSASTLVMTAPLVLLWATTWGCGTEQLTFETNQAPSISAVPGEHAGLGGASSDDLRRGGWAGGFTIVNPAGIGPLLLQASEVCIDEQHGPLVADHPDQCLAGTLCARTGCQSDADCPSYADMPRAKCVDYQGFNFQTICSYPCQTSGDCPAGLTCAELTEGGATDRACVFDDVTWAPGCPDYCMDETASDVRGVYCNVREDCCAGLSCSPVGTCQKRECLEFGWRCDADTPCCSGLACQDGVCQTG